MKRIVLILSLSIATIAFADVRPAPADVFSEAVERLADVYAPAKKTAPRTFSAKLNVVRSSLKEAQGRTAMFAFQAPDKLRLSAEVDQRLQVVLVGEHIRADAHRGYVLANGRVVAAGSTTELGESKLVQEAFLARRRNERATAFAPIGSGGTR